MIVIHFLALRSKAEALQRVADVNQSLDQSFDWAHHWTEQALSNAININRESFIKCDRRDQNKLCYMHVVDMNQ